MITEISVAKALADLKIVLPGSTLQRQVVLQLTLDYGSDSQHHYLALNDICLADTRRMPLNGQ